MAKQARRIGIYTRISQIRDDTAADGQVLADRQALASQALVRQLADCQALVERHGWIVAGLYEDPDESGYSTSAKRPEYRRLLADLEAGAIDGVCVWKLDRLGRRLTETNKVVARIDELGAVLLSVNEQLDTSTPMGRAIIGFIAAQAETESANTSVRIKRAMADQIAAGTIPTGGSRCFGYSKLGDVIEAEATVVREMAEWFIEGTSYRQIAARLNEAGAVTSTGRPWQGYGVRQLLLSPRIGGYRLGTDGRTLVRGAWTALLDDELWTALQAATAKAKRPAQRANEVAHLLTGLAVCGKCGGHLNHLKYHSGSGVIFPRLSCTKEPGKINCGALAATEAGVDRVVVARLIEHLDAEPTAPAIDTEALGRQVADDRRSRDELARARFVERTIDQPTFELLHAELSERIEDAERALDSQLGVGQRMTVTALTEGAIPFGGTARWNRLDLAQRRALLRSKIERVVIHPAARRGGNVFDESRVEIVWRPAA